MIVTANNKDTILLHGAPVWYQVVKYRGRMKRVQRRALPGFGSAYKIVSTAGLQVITGVTRIHLQADGQRRVHVSGTQNRAALRGATKNSSTNGWTTSADYYTRRIGKDADNESEYYGEADSAKYTVFKCVRWV